MRAIEGLAVVPASPPEVFAFLSALENHWLVADRFVEVVSLDDQDAGGVVRVRGPLGISRTAATRVTAVEPPSRITGTAEIGRGTRARVSWTLSGRGEATLVRLEATIERATPLDRLLLAAGGALWLRRRFAGALGGLARRFEGRAASASSACA